MAMAMNDRLGRQQGFPSGAAAKLSQSTLTPTQVLRDLKLSGILDTLPERVELARQIHLPYPEFLTVILADDLRAFLESLPARDTGAA